jgi:pilus assembly protein Flp/PilA
VGHSISAVLKQLRLIRRGERKMKVARRFLSNESGATAIEYGLLAALISVVIIGAVKVAGTNLLSTFTSVGSNLS